MNQKKLDDFLYRLVPVFRSTWRLFFHVPLKLHPSPQPLKISTGYHPANNRALRNKNSQNYRYYSIERVVRTICLSWPAQYPRIMFHSAVNFFPIYNNHPFNCSFSAFFPIKGINHWLVTVTNCYGELLRIFTSSTVRRTCNRFSSPLILYHVSCPCSPSELFWLVVVWILVLPLMLLMLVLLSYLSWLFVFLLVLLLK